MHLSPNILFKAIRWVFKMKNRAVIFFLLLFGSSQTLPYDSNTLSNEYVGFIKLFANELGLDSIEIESTDNRYLIAYKSGKILIGSKFIELAKALNDSAFDTIIRFSLMHELWHLTEYNEDLEYDSHSKMSECVADAMGAYYLTLSEVDRIDQNGFDLLKDRLVILGTVVPEFLSNSNFDPNSSNYPSPLE